MKKILSLFLFAILTNTAFATVGGSLIIGEFYYNPEDESVYYKKNDNGGRGCKTMVEKISLNNFQTKIVHSCEMGEQFKTPEDNEAFVNETLNKFKKMEKINLRRNGFVISGNHTGDKFITDPANPDVKEKTMSNFKIYISQNGKKLLNFDTTGCEEDEPINFSGFRVPGYERKIILKSSGVSNCMEGGYIGQKAYVIAGVSGLKDKKFDVKELSEQNPESVPTVKREDLLIYVKPKANSFWDWINWGN